MPNYRPGIAMTLVLALCLSRVAPAEAGLLDSIKSMFGFGAKPEELTGAASPSSVTSLLDQLDESQRDVAAKQQELASIYNGPVSGIQAKDEGLQKKLDALSQSSRTNESLFLRLLQARADIQRAGKEKDLEPVAERISKASSTQDQLESNYQKIQDANVKAGLMTPPAAASAVRPSDIAAGTGSGLPPYQDPLGQQYIAEWLSICQLNQYGQWEGTSASAVVRSAGNPFEGMTPQEGVWRALANETKGANMTLQQYVMAKLEGQDPLLTFSGRPGAASTTRPATAAVAAKPVRASITASTAAAGSGTAAGGAATTAQLEGQITSAYESLVALQKSGKGSTEEAKTLLGRLKALQDQKASSIRSGN